MRLSWLVIVLLLSAPAAGASQTPTEARAFARDGKGPDQPAAAERAPLGGLFVDLAHDVVRFPSKDTALTLGIGGALALAVLPADPRLTQRVAGSETLDEVLDPGAAAGSGWAQAGASMAVYLMGHAMAKARVQALGADLLQAQLLTAGLTQTIKLAVSRRRPDDGRRSFPSGHASATFASATVVARRFGWKAGVPAFAVAGYVAASRLSENRHYASDVIFGSALGIAVGRTVTVGRGAARFAPGLLATEGGGGITFTRLY